MTPRPTTPTICGLAWRCHLCNARLLDTAAAWKRTRTAGGGERVEAVCVTCSQSDQRSER